MFARVCLLAPALAVAVILPVPTLAQEKAWDVSRQEEAVSLVEKAWEEIQGLLDSTVPEERQSLIMKHSNLAGEMVDIADRITAPGPRSRLEKVRDEMKASWDTIHWIMLKNLEEGTSRLLRLMEESYEDRRFPEVRLIHEMWLDRLLTMMVTSPDLMEPAEALRAKVKDLLESTLSAQEIEAGGIVVMGDGWIQNHRETPGPVPDGTTWLPVARRYRHRDCIRGRPDLQVERFVQDRLQVIHTRADGSRRSVLLPYQWPAVSRRAWEDSTQAIFLAVWEKRWEEWQAAKEPDERAYRDLREDIYVWGQRITATDVRKRLDGLEQSMRVKCPLRLRSIDACEEALAGMEHAFDEWRYGDVSRAYLERLWPAAKALEKEDPELAKVMLEQGRALQQKSRPLDEVGSWGLELLSTDVGGQTRTATIVNHALRVDGAEPSAKKYLEGDAIDRIEVLTVLEISEDRVRCRYRDRYVVDLFPSR